MPASPKVEQVVQQLQDCKGTWPEIQVSTGLSYFTIARIAAGKVPNPSTKTIEALEQYFSGKRKPARAR